MKNRKLFVLVLMLAFVLLLSACQQQKAEKAPAPIAEATAETVAQPAEKPVVETKFGLTPLAEKTKLRIGFFSGSPHSMPWYIAEQEGFWKELNIEVEYVPFINGPAMVEANSNWDIASLGAPGCIAGELGHNLRMIGAADYENNLGLFVRKDSPLAKGEENAWKGSTWLYPIGTSLHMTLLSAIEKHQINLDDITSINMDVNSAMTAFKGGQGDGIAVWNAFYFDAEDNGFVKIEDTRSLNGTNLIGILSSPGALEKKRELIKTAWWMYYKTWEWCKSSDENMKKAIDYYIQSCEDEGIVTNENVATRSMQTYACPSPAEAVAIMTEKVADPMHSDTQILRGERDQMITMDFFVSQGKYKEADRDKILSDKLVDPSIAEEFVSWIQ